MKKILALYLPQYHRIKENDEWWGDGYTEWIAVKNAKKYFKTHQVPKIPLDNNYYDLSEKSAETWRWQANLSQKYGIYGFAIYHYWFGKKKMLLEKPVEILLENRDIKLNYCFVWANESWSRTWYDGNSSRLLIKQEYCDRQDWLDHFNYFLPFFKDERYIKVDGKPLLHIYKSLYIEEFDEMISCWNDAALEHGFPGLYIVVGNTTLGIDNRVSSIDAYYNFEPGFSQKYHSSLFRKIFRKATILSKVIFNSLSKTKHLERKEQIDYIYRNILKNKPIINKKKVFLGTFPSWDNTPRRGYHGTCFVGESPEKFYKSLKCIYDMSCDDSFIYINAWNEWGEGCYLEPDVINKFGYLDAVRKVADNEK